MKPLSLIGYLHLTKFAKPVCDREIYSVIKKYKFRSFVEIGMGDGSRCENMIKVAQRFGESKNVRFTGIDLFDSRTEGEELPLIDTHRRLKSLANTKSQLVPGPVQPAVARIANSHVRTDLIVVSALPDPAEMAEAWFYFPRMLHAGSVILHQSSVGGKFKTLNRHQIEKMVDQDKSDLAKAA